MIVTRLEEVQAKLEMVREFAAERGLAAMVLATRANFAWLTAGGANHVGLDAETGVCWLVVTRDGQHLLTDNIEAGRFADEEIGELPFEIHSAQWDEADRAAMLTRLAAQGAGADWALPGTQNVADDFARLRWRLLEPEIERYREVAALASRAIAQTGREIEPGMTEHEIAGLLMGKVFAAGAQPVVALIAADERAYRYRHPIPTQARLRRHVMIVIGATRYGLGVYATRMVHFGEPPAELRDRHVACCLVDACFNLHTVPGAKVSEIFRAAADAYAQAGYPDEWRLHHQGGATGYAPREYKGTLTCEEIVLEDQAFAWNPSVAGTKSEDTIIARAGGPQFLTGPDGWPTLEITYGGETLQRPDILVR
ncbi:MAG: M24 family metallopeptidase [Armatimonadota bacterium]